MGLRDKKRHRLEKALANSAAIISELEKKKQKKKEEQERLDEEGALVAEAVALHVLIGEDCDESRQPALNKHRRCNKRRVLSPRSAGPKKQAEKKRRLLEKALATSAAIISELEKKKQKKKEEHERLDEEGASVAVHVLIGEDSDGSRHLALNKHRRCNEGRVLSPRSAGPKKQAEKKRRLLEKALATSAAIISELEKKKQKKKEEHERLDEEGASISEAVALHVPIGEDSDESHHLALNKHRRCNERHMLSPPSGGPKKQADKKRRLLEKALAASAAIISELEKKKQQKKEEHERLDEEGALISEAGSLHVLIDDDSDESRHLVLNKHRRCNNWDPSAGFDFTLDAQGAADIYSPGGLMCANQAYASKGRWSDWGNAHPPPKGEVRELKASCYQGTFHQSKVACPGLMAAQALSSLQIRED